MEGIKEKSSSEEEKILEQKTEVGIPVNSSKELTSLQTPKLQGQLSSRIHELRALLLSAEYSQQNWPGEALRSVVHRFVRMPRTGWQLFRDIYVEKFKIEVSLDELKRRAESFISSQAGLKCSRRKYITESSKRIKTVENLFEDNTLHQAKVITKAREVFRKELASIKLKEVAEVEWTRKVQSEKFDFEILEAIDQVANETLIKNPPSSWKDIVVVIQAIQRCYQSMTEKEKKQSSWTKSIQSKIESLKSKTEVLKRIQKQEKPEAEDIKTGRRIMRELNLILQLKDDKAEAIDIIEQKAAVYQRKLDSYAQRKDFRKDNMCFELYRSKFYRGFDGTQPVEQTVENNKVRKFWETMWTQSSTEPKEYSRYLYDFIPGPETEEVFPSIQEFLTIVRQLPSWKAAGIDGIYNFFLKKCSSLHEHLYRLVKATCMGEIKGESWFYTGITYLIPKGIPVKGSDFRPITCMSNFYKLTTKCVTQVLQEVVENRYLLSENQLGTVPRVQGAKEQAMINIAIYKAIFNL